MPTIDITPMNDTTLTNEEENSVLSDGQTMSCMVQDVYASRIQILFHTQCPGFVLPIGAVITSARIFYDCTLTSFPSPAQFWLMPMNLSDIEALMGDDGAFASWAMASEDMTVAWPRGPALLDGEDPPISPGHGGNEGYAADTTLPEETGTQSFNVTGMFQTWWNQIRGENPATNLWVFGVLMCLKQETALSPEGGFTLRTKENATPNTIFLRVAYTELEGDGRRRARGRSR